jgi:tetratricopeptide (TPR) repeat protein
VVAVIVVAGASALFFRPGTPALTERDVILLADFVNDTGDPAFDGTLKQGLATQLEQSPFLSFFPDTRVRETLRYMQQPVDRPVTGDIAREICQRERLKAVLEGNIKRVGSNYVIGLEATNCATGESIAREQREAPTQEQVLTELGKAATSLRSRLGESLASIQKFDTPIEKATTKSLEALRAFTEGRRLNSAGEFREAISFLERAVELDPEFAMGHYLLGTARRNAGQDGNLASIKAFELRDRASELERLSITTVYYWTVAKDWNKGLETLGVLKQVYPRDAVGHLLSGTALRSMGRLEDALKENQEAVRLNPASILMREDLVDSYFHLNRFADAKATLHRESDGQPLEAPSFHALRYVTAFLQGDASSMQREIDWSHAHPENRQMQNARARIALFHGNLSLFRELSVQAPARGGRPGRSDSNDPFALVPPFEGVAMEISPNASGDLPRTDSPAADVVAFSLNRSTPLAQRRTALEQLAKEAPQATMLNSVVLPAARAALELEEGKPAAAINELQGVPAYERSLRGIPAIYLRGSAYLEAKSGTEAVGEFQKLIDNRGVDPLSVLHAVGYVGLGRGYTLANEPAKARAAYETFFNLWKNADSRIPILIHAKQEYARLTP